MVDKISVPSSGESGARSMKDFAGLSAGILMGGGAGERVELTELDLE